MLLISQTVLIKCCNCEICQLKKYVITLEIAEVAKIRFVSVHRGALPIRRKDHEKRNKERKQTTESVSYFTGIVFLKGMKGSVLALCFSVGDYRLAMCWSRSQDLSRNRQTFLLNSAFLPISRVSELCVSDSVHFVTSNRKSGNDEDLQLLKCVTETIYDLVNSAILRGHVQLIGHSANDLRNGNRIDNRNALSNIVCQRRTR